MKEHAAMVIKNKEDKILFIQRSLKKKTLPGAWSFPSGTKEENESIFNTALRESYEELGIKVIPNKIMATKDLPELSSRLLFILCDINDNQEPEIKAVDEIEQFKWMSFNEFFGKFNDNQIGHGLVWLRQNPDIWNNL
jgi:8-oxo-dGTP pyrophosphatase MutT (NUDIX family)